MAGSANAGIPTSRATRLGGVTIEAITDAHGSFANFSDAFPAAGEDLEAIGRRHYGDLFLGERWLLPFRAFLVRSERQAVLVDVGVGPPPGEFLPDRQGWLPAGLAAAGIAPEDVDVVILTHLHVDHVGWAAVADAPFFPRARYVTSKLDWRFFANRPESRRTFAKKLAPLARAGVLELVDREDVEVAPGVLLRSTPGHTPGHMSVDVRGDLGRALILGDVAVHPLQLHEPSLAYVYEEDPPAAAATRKQLLRELMAADLVVAAGHFPGGLGWLERDGRRFAWTG